MVTFQELNINKDGTELSIKAIIPDLPYYENVYIDKVYIDNQDSFIESGPSKQSMSFIPTNKEVIKVADSDFNIAFEDEEFVYYEYIHNVEEDKIYDFSNFTLLDSEEDKLNVIDFPSIISPDRGFKPSYLKAGYYSFKGTSIVRQFKTIDIVIKSTEALYNFNTDLLFVYIKTKGTPSPDTPCGMDNITTLGVVSNLYPLYQHAFNYIKELSDTCSIPKNFINYILQYKAFELAVKTGHYTKAIKYWKKFFMGIKDSVITPNCGCYGQGT